MLNWFKNCCWIPDLTIYELNDLEVELYDKLHEDNFIYHQWLNSKYADTLHRENVTYLDVVYLLENIKNASVHVGDINLQNETDIWINSKYDELTRHHRTAPRRPRSP